MVYQGKPSRGCGTCRQRRVKCDERKPTCLRCEKARRTCTGYRPEFEIVHRNENRSLERRIRGGTSDKGQPAVRVNTESGVWLHSEHGNWQLTPPPESSGPSPPPRDQSLSPSLSVSIDEQASCHFAANFILVPLTSHRNGHLDFVLPLIAKEPPNSPLRHAFRACAYAAFGGARKTNGIDLPGMARKEYAEALNTTHLWLGNPSVAKSDSLVASVLLLILFETMTATKDTGMLAWRSHVEGAAILIKARGRDQLQTGIGRQLFNAVRHSLIARILSSGTQPAMGADWWTDADTQMSFVAVECQNFALRTSELRAETSKLMTTVQRDPETLELMLEIAGRVQLLDQQVASWLVSLPEEYRFKTLCWQELPQRPPLSLPDADVFPGRVDVYPDFIIAQSWNMARATRLILASLNIRLTAWICSPVDYRTTPEYATSKLICEGIISDAIASIPYHLGWHTRRKELFDNPELLGFACGLENSSKILSAHFAAWPLACVHTNDIATEAQREWCKGRLHYIASELGLKYAQLLADTQVRYPSMMIRQDGLMPSPDPLSLEVGGGLKVPRSPSRSSP